MWILLPPSETKRRGGNTPASALAFGAVLNGSRTQVRRAVEALSQNPEEARRALKLGVKNQDEYRLNLELETNELAPAIERYTGVLYDAIDAATLDPASRDWLDQHVLIQSALFGLISAADAIPAYRLSASTRLPELGATLKRHWQAAHDPVWEDAPYILDLRAKDYAALAPFPTSAGDAVTVLARDASGELRALNHFNKAGKGVLVRALAQDRPRITRRADLLEWAAERGIELGLDANGGLCLITTAGVPAATVPAAQMKR